MPTGKQCPCFQQKSTELQNHKRHARQNWTWPMYICQQHCVKISKHLTNGNSSYIINTTNLLFWILIFFYHVLSAQIPWQLWEKKWIKKWYLEAIIYPLKFKDTILNWVKNNHRFQELFWHQYIYTCTIVDLFCKN